MTAQQSQQIIEQARLQFERDLKSREFASITADDAQLARILETCRPRNGGDYLDLGSGQGYIAFALARHLPAARIAAVDIVAAAMARNAQAAAEQGLGNLVFQPFDGVSLPFGEARFDGVFSRYAFHHFPEPQTSVREIARALKPGGFCMITDPAPCASDGAGFADAFSRLRPDGHVCYYSIDSLDALFCRGGLWLESVFFNEITFPRALDERYEALLAQTPPSTLALYRVEQRDGKLYATLKIMNALFRKR